MKFGLFYNPQVPKAIGSDDWEPEQERQAFIDLLDQVEAADRLGFDYLFLGEHHFTPEYAHNSAPEVILGALARSTKNIRIGSGITHISHNDPLRTAERAATIDLISNGRFELGLGVGGASEIEPFIPDLSPQQQRERAAEASQIVVDVLRERGLYEGTSTEHFSIGPVNVVPKSYQRPHPPLWSASVRIEGTIEAAEKGMGSLVLSAGGPPDVALKVDAYWNALRDRCAPIGEAINPAVFTFANGIVAETDEQAQERAREGLEFFGYGLMGGASLVRSTPGHLYQHYRDFADGKGDARQALDGPGGGSFSFADAPGNLLRGVDGARRLAEELESVHTDAMLFTQQMGWTKHEHVMESIELIATRIMPDFRDRHALQQEWRREQLAGVPFPVNSSV